jgi:hypothetical protein
MAVSVAVDAKFIAPEGNGTDVFSVLIAWVLVI